MKNWLSIGKFSKQAGLSARSLRIYEEMGLIHSHTRGENGYRYYLESQLETALRIKTLKALGFNLSEVKSLLHADSSMDSGILRQFLQRRLQAIAGEEQSLRGQRDQINTILSSLENVTVGLSPNERRYIMSHFEKISVVVTGVKDLNLTADHIRRHLLNAGQVAEVYMWDEDMTLPAEKPYILVIPEARLASQKVASLTPDVVVIKNLSAFNSDLEAAYLQLYSAVGPHMTTIFNADDRISLELAAHAEICKGRIFYFSKNFGLEEQIKNIGGVISDGDEVKIFNFNLAKDSMSMKFSRALAFDEETALIASIAAVMDVGLDRASVNLQST